MQVFNKKKSASYDADFLMIACFFDYLSLV